VCRPSPRLCSAASIDVSACRRDRRHRARSSALGSASATRPLRTMTGRSGSIRDARPSAWRTRSSSSRPLPPSSARSSTTRLGRLTSIARTPSPGPRRARHSKAVSGEIVEQERPRRLIVLDNQDLPLLVHAGLRPPAEFLGPEADVETAHWGAAGVVEPRRSAGDTHPQFSPDRLASVTNKLANCGFFFEIAPV
jgi:hypothetical protein